MIDYLRAVANRPRQELTRRQNQLRYAGELVVHCGRQLQRHRAEGMAAELTYRTIFALIPVVVLGLVLFRVVGGLDDVRNRVENQLYSFFGVPEVPADYGVESNAAAFDFLSGGEAPADDPNTDTDSADSDSADAEASDAEVSGEETSGNETSSGEKIADAEENGSGPPPAADFSVDDDQAADGGGDDSADAARDDSAETGGDESADANGDGEPDDREARASIRRTLRQTTNAVMEIDFRSIGVIGLLLFLYAAVALADSTEHLFNCIYGAPRARPIHLRLAIHWSIITLGSGLLSLSLYLSGQFLDWLVGSGSESWPTWVITRAMSVLASWMLLFLLYALMPNTHVSVRAAAIGAATASVLWEVAKVGFQTYVATAVPYSALYGSLGLIPLFLFWIYLTWWIVLFGIILTHSLQTLRGRHPAREDAHDALPPGDPDWILPIMAETAHAFESGDAIDSQELADRLGLSPHSVQELLPPLIEAGWIRRVHGGASATSDTAVTLAKPADQIGLRAILELALRQRPGGDHPAWKRLVALKRSEIDAVGGETLANLELVRDGETDRSGTDS